MRCTSYGKVCVVIIDGGSFENVVSANMVEKLKLKVKNHPKPYNLSLMDKKNEIKVSKCYLIQLSIGEKYKDEIICDMGTMDAYHLLGRPFDQRTKHDGCKDTYSFVNDDVKIVMGPTKERRMSQLSRSKFIKEIEFVKSEFTLVIFEKNKKCSNIYKESQSLLKEFVDVAPKKFLLIYHQ